MRWVFPYQKSPLGFIALLTLFPLMELWVYRSVVHRRFDRPVLWTGQPWPDLFIPLIALSIVLVFRLAKHSELRLELEPKKFRDPLVLFVLSLLSLELPLAIGDSLQIALFLLLGVASLTYSVLVWWLPLKRDSFAYLWANAKPLFFVAAGAFTVLVFPFASLGWNLLVKSLIWPVKALVTLFGVYPAFYYVNEILYLVHRNFSANISHYCSGIDGIFLFLLVFSIIATQDPRNISMKRWFAIFAGGVLLMWALNAIRISAFYVLSFYAVQSFGEVYATELFSRLFHSNVGWFLYLFGIVGYTLWFESLFRKTAPLNREAE